MTATTFEQRAEELAVKNGFSWPLLEEELRIEQVQFYGPEKGPPMAGTSLGDTTRKSRMWLEVVLGALANTSGQVDISCSDFREAAEAFFGPELCAEAEKHPFIMGILQGVRATAWLKTTHNVRIAAVPDLVKRGWAGREELNTSYRGPIRSAVERALDLLDSGQARVAEPDGQGGYRVNEWLKQAVLLSFKLNDNEVIDGGSAGHPAYDKVPSKFKGWSKQRFADAGFRVAPGAIARRGAFVGERVVLMPSFVNIGAFVDEGTMVDTWATVGSCAQIGKGVHLSGGAGIGGVLEPLQAGPVVIEDGAFIGARSEVVEGVIIGKGAVLAPGCFIGSSTKIVDRLTGKVHYGKVPPYSVVVPGSFPGKPLLDGSPGPSLYCVVIVKTVDAQTRSKVGINELLHC